MAGYTPMIEQYLGIKALQQDAILMFRLGDFYEMFFEDAQTAARELDIVLTARDGGVGKIPMCGVPHHAASNYIAKLIGKGYKVAICEQVENPKQAAGIVKREVTRVITPGTILDELMLQEGKNNYLAAVYEENKRVGLAFIDISTGDFLMTEMSGPGRLDELDSELQRLEPAECLLPAGSSLDSLWQDNFSRQEMSITRIETALPTTEEAVKIINDYLGPGSVPSENLAQYSCGIKAASAILKFVTTNHKQTMSHIRSLEVYKNSSFMELDATTRRNLELTASLREGKKEGSLLGIIDQCRTAMGKRTIRQWLEQPLRDLAMIEARHEAVQELLECGTWRQEIREVLGKIYDLERLAGKTGSGQATPRDLLTLKHTLQVLPDLQILVKQAQSTLLRTLGDFETLPEVYSLLDRAIHEEAPLAIKEGGIIKAGYNAEIDELRSLSSEGKNWLLDFESREKEKTGIRSLKVGYNRVFGYYIEVGNANRHAVPLDYVRKQTLVNAERFVTEELKNYEEKILGARDRLHALEHECFIELRQELQDHVGRIKTSGRMIARLDVLAGLAQAAHLNNYVRPQLGKDGRIEVKAGRHPVVEKYLRESRFVPNDLALDNEGSRFAVITGPNMGGKSTYMRQAALLVILAQMGSFVPADYARIGLVDRIFTRVGAADDLSGGQSTFMVEMLELAKIIDHATQESLVILDEVGRGTSTYDGLSIAQAASEYIHEKLKAKTLFATHYHELTQLAEKHPGIFNLSVSVLETGDTVTFLKKVLPGKADKSYGIHVAKLAGIPLKVINRAYAILEGLENEQRPAPQTAWEQISLFKEDSSQVLEELENLNVDELTPRDALLLIYRWKELR